MRFARVGTSAAIATRFAANRWTTRCGSRCGSFKLAVGAEKRPNAITPPEPTRRLFFALWPDEVMRGGLARAIRKAVRGSGGRPVPTESLHITLAFLGSVPERRVAALGALAGKVAGELAGFDRPLTLRLDRLEHWRAARLLCVLPA